MIREAYISDIKDLHEIRIAVKENVLSDPSRITEQDYADMLERYGKGWVYEVDVKIKGFAIVDLRNNNVWALFVHPHQESKGIGLALLRHMTDWCFLEKDLDSLWLTTDPGTRAEKLYRKAGWLEEGMETNGEIRFSLYNPARRK